MMINQPTSTAFYMKNNFWTKFFQKWTLWHCVSVVRDLAHGIPESNFETTDLESYEIST